MTDPTRYFYELTPHTVLDAVEELGVRCTGRALALNSMENRVYEVEIEVENPEELKSRYDAFRVAKFYRPGRWSKAQIQEEHDFLFELEQADVPVVTPLRFPDGESLRKVPGQELWYTVFPKVGGRNLDELNGEQLEMVGRTLARLHTVGASRSLEHRPPLNHETYGVANLEYLLSSQHLPKELRQQYTSLVQTICSYAEPLFKIYPSQRAHSDFHVGNVLWLGDQCFVVDFDDMASAPPIQDLWLITPGRDETTIAQRDRLVSAYESLRSFERESLGVVECLRALRMIRFSAWIAMRWEDPAFPQVFPEFGSLKYWREQIGVLMEQVEVIQGGF